MIPRLFLDTSALDTTPEMLQKAEETTAEQRSRGDEHE